MTERPDGLRDVCDRKFNYGNSRWIYATINKRESDWCLYINSMSPFNFMPSPRDKFKLHTQLDDYHALIDEANDVLRAYFTEAHEYLLKMISELPEI